MPCRRRRRVTSSGRSSVLAVITVALAFASADGVRTSGTPVPAIQVGRSINMVSGTKWPTGDPFLQRQNEPSMAASTRNPLHLLAGANDYRTVDLPGSAGTSETGDAWLGLFKSFDGGERWQSNLVPGYPQDTSADGMASPLKAYQAGADPVVRPGTNGLFYYSGLAFNRGADAPSAVFVARFVDNNNKENGDPIGYIGTTVVDKSAGASFLDKPWIAVDVPREGARTCRIEPHVPPAGPHGHGRPARLDQTILAGTIYVSYSRITTTATSIESRIMFTHSEDCGVTWSKPVRISSPADQVNQGSSIAIDPRTGAVYVSWRQFAVGTTEPDSIMVARSITAGRVFDPPSKVHKFFVGHRAGELLEMLGRGHRMGDPDQVSQIDPFDQATAADRFRTNAYPTLAIDDESRVYAAWTERGFGVARPDPTGGDARVVIATSHDGQTWTAPHAIDTGVPGADQPGHQLMPSIVYAGGHLMVVYYDLREDVSRVFGPFIDESDAIATVHIRHTIDIRATQAAKADDPVFGPSVQVSRYLLGSVPGSSAVEQLQYDPPNLPLFQLGSVPFMGDYIDLAPAPAFVKDARGRWTFNTQSSTAPVFHAVWTDNRDVRPPADGDWTHYTPVGSTGGASTFDPTSQTPACVPGQTGMRNQNIYTARLTFGLVAGSPGNTKPLDPTLPRAFVVYAQNTTTSIKSFRMAIGSQPVGGSASFVESATSGQPFPLASVDVNVAPLSLAARSVFVTSSDPTAQVPVSVQEIAPDGTIVSGGLASTVILNPDISNPDISNPDISNPDISNPDISNAEVYNPDISNPDISNPDISNPDISNPDISNPDISNVVVANPDISNPDISNPDISNPDISNPDISNPDISNTDMADGSVNDVTWTITNTGNTTGAFNLTLFLNNAAASTGGIKTQLIIHKNYTTPVAAGCSLKQQTTSVLVDNIVNPTFQPPGTPTPLDPSNPALTTLWLEPGGQAKITLRIVDPDPGDGITLNPVTDVTPFVQAQAVNTPDLGTEGSTPPSTEPPQITPTVLAFTSQPSGALAGAPLGPIVVNATNNGNPDAGVQVTLAIAVNPAGGHLSGTVTALSDAQGNATFTGLSIDKAGLGYVFSASASAAAPVLSQPFDVLQQLNAPQIDLAGNMLGDAQTLLDFQAANPAGTYAVDIFTCIQQGPPQQLGSVTVSVTAPTARTFAYAGAQIGAGQSVAIRLRAGAAISPLSSCLKVGSYAAGSPQPVAYYNGHYYTYVTVPQTWDQADGAANSSTFAGLSGHLVTIGDANENAFVQSLFGKMGLTDMRAWIGLRDTTGQFNWAWVTGEPTTYFDWAAGEPNNKGVERWVEFFASGAWNNNSDQNSFIQGYVVEYELPIVPAIQ